MAKLTKVGLWRTDQNPFAQNLALPEVVHVPDTKNPAVIGV